MNTIVLARSGVQLAVDDGGTGTAVAFLHGLAGFKELWAEILPPVRAVGFRAIAYDHRGHGESGDLPAPWTIADLADDLLSVLDQLEIARACIVGHSMGGRTMFQFALAHPGRISALVAVGAHSEAPHSPYREVLAGLREATARGGLAAFRAAFEAAAEIPERTYRDPLFARGFEQCFSRNRPSALVTALDAILSMQNLTRRLREITVPALAIVGDRDTPFRELADYYQEAIPNCRTVVIPDCHHYPMTDQPERFTEVLLEFLNERRAEDV